MKDMILFLFSHLPLKLWGFVACILGVNVCCNSTKHIQREVLILNKKITWGLLVLVIAIAAFVIARTQSETFQAVYNISAIVVIILISLLFFRKKT